MNRHHKNLALVVWGLMGVTVYAQGTLDLNERIVPMQAPFNMPMLKRPSFPEAEFNIEDFNAVADGKTKNTEAFAQAINACHQAGGGRVVVPAGAVVDRPHPSQEQCQSVSVRRGGDCF